MMHLMIVLWWNLFCVLAATCAFINWRMCRCNLFSSVSRTHLVFYTKDSSAHDQSKRVMFTLLCSRNHSKFLHELLSYTTVIPDHTLTSIFPFLSRPRLAKAHESEKGMSIGPPKSLWFLNEDLYIWLIVHHSSKCLSQVKS